MVRKFFKKKPPGEGAEDASYSEGIDRSGEPTAGAQAKAWVTGALSQVTGQAADKFEETAEKLNEVLPYLERAGFHVTEIEVQMGITPALIPHVRVGDVLPKAERPALMAEIKGRKFATGILSSLFRAADFGKRIDLKGFRFFEIEIEVGIIPSITVKYMPNERIAPPAGVSE